MFSLNQSLRSALWGLLISLVPSILIFLAFFWNWPASVFLPLFLVPLLLIGVSTFWSRSVEKERALILGLENKNRELQKRLELVTSLSGRGILSFGQDFVVENGVSPEAVKILGQDPQGLSVDHVLFRDSQVQEDFRSGLSLVFTKAAHPEVVFDLLEHDLRLNDRAIHVDYHLLDEKTVSCFLTDQTDAQRLNELLRKDTEQRGKILKVLNHRLAFADLTREANSVFETLATFEDQTPNTEVWEEFARQLHTFKANAGFFDFAEAASKAHDLEQLLVDHLTLGLAPEVEAPALELKRTYFADLKSIMETLGEGWLREADGIVVPRTSYTKLESYLKKSYQRDRNLHKFLAFHRQIPLRTLLEKLPDQARTLAIKLGKRLKPLDIVGGDFKVLPDRFEPLVQTFIHLIRNSLDHGIETVREREALQKDAAGKLGLEIVETPKAILFRFSDDGKGISFQKVWERAKEKGWMKPGDPLDEQALLSYLFRQDFSTADEVSETSGRGVGLAAVKEAVDKSRGSIRILTRPGKGTTFEIIIPQESS